MPKLHALFTAVDAYPLKAFDGIARFPNLTSCLNDVAAVREMLAADPDFELHAFTLTNDQATKARIVSEFDNHLGQAGPDDVVLFYFAGHGTVEKADPAVWTEESGTRLECLVCHAEQPTARGNLLADKELRFLISRLYEKTQAHIVVVADCCHSADNTRAALPGDEVLTERQGRFAAGFAEFPARAWADFILADTYPPAHFQGKGLDEALPPAPHVQLAACERNQSAVETRGHGVLTFHLLRALHRTGGHLRYRDLIGRIRNEVKYGYDQRPRLYTPPGSGLADLGFLKKTVGGAAETATLIYNAQGEYRLDRGVQHRVEQGVTTVAATGIDGCPVIGRVASAELAASVVEFSVAALQNLKRATQTARVDNLSNRLLRIHLLNKDLAHNSLRGLLDGLNAPENAPFFAFDDDLERADFTLVLWRGMAYFTRPGDAYLFQPLILPVSTVADGAAERLAADLRHMSQWKFAEGLTNEAENALQAEALQVEFFSVGPDGAETPLPAPGHRLRLPLDQRPDPKKPGLKKWNAQLRIKITNRSDGDLYVAALYCSYDFSIETASLLHPTVTHLPPAPDPDASKWVCDHKNGAMSFGLNETVRLFNWSDSTETVKILYSTEPFDDLDALELPGLPQPHKLAKQENSRAANDAENETPREAGVRLDGWNALDIQISIENPLYNRVDKAELARYLAGDDPENVAQPELAHFLLGLYFEKSGALNGELTLKPFLQEKAGEESLRGVFWDALLGSANRWAGYWRRRAYNQAIKDYPDRPRIVSEGDSWFQHPTVSDIIDHVSKFYPVYCIAAAGDTIRNWSREGKVLEAVAEQQPAFLLMSGGGNDILGESLLHFLADVFDEAPEGKKPARFFKALFDDELDAIAENYRTLFRFFAENRPDMPILVHGYDYPRPLKADDKGTSWLGRYFTGKKILREGDRRQAVHYMIDRFNKKLAAVAAEFPGQVHYLDLRKIVRDDQWSDEIHPNDDGFQDISARFVEKITALGRV